MHEGKLIEVAAKFGHPLPQAIADAPELMPTLQLFWTCYFDLRRGKDKHTPLSWWEVQYWCDTYLLPGDLGRAVHNYTLELDHIWLSLQPKKA